MRKTVYQTLEDRENPDEIERNGPFPCNWENTWLGNGYYFWDTFLENAHWWGKQPRYKGRYIICEASFDYNLETCFDLVGTTEHLLDFEKSYKLVKNKFPLDPINVARVISFMTTTDSFKYHAVRAFGILSKKPKLNKFKLPFEIKRNLRAYLDYKPAIQIVLFNCPKVDFKNYTVIYPDEYISGFAI